MRARAGGSALAAWQMSAGGAALAGLVVEGGPPGAGPRELALVVGLAVLGSAAEVSAWFFLVPAVGVASAWPLLGEVPSVRLLIGLAAVCGGLWL